MAEQRDLVPPINPDQAEFNRRFEELRARATYDDRLKPYLAFDNGTYQVNTAAVTSMDQDTADTMAILSERDHNALLALAQEITTLASNENDVTRKERLFMLALSATDQATGLRKLRELLQATFTDLDEPNLETVASALGRPARAEGDTPPADAPETDTPEEADDTVGTGDTTETGTEEGWQDKLLKGMGAAGKKHFPRLTGMLSGKPPIKQHRSGSFWTLNPRRINDGLRRFTAEDETGEDTDNE